MAAAGTTQIGSPSIGTPISYPPLFKAADNTSRTNRKWYVSLISSDIALLIAGAVAGSLSTVGPARWQQVAAVISAICIATGILLRWVNRAEKPEKKWFQGRAVAEAVKASSWRYMMRIEPFDGEDDAAKTAFLATLDALRTRHRDVTFATNVVGSQLPESMRNIRAQELPDRQTTYMDQRLNDQIRWYENRANFHLWRGRLLLGLGIGSEVLALAWLLIRIALSTNLNIIAVFTSIAVAATALSQLNDHDELAQRYADAQQNLQEILARLPTSDLATLAGVVTDTEGVISAENTIWITKRS